MPRRRVNNPLALAVLACLCERPMHPYEISTTLRHRGKEDSIKLNYGSLYSVVESLQKHDLISSRTPSREGRRPERTVYEITAAGVAEYADWMAELLSTPVREFTSLEAGLSLMAGVAPDTVVLLLTKRAERLRVELRALEGSHEEAAALHLPEILIAESRYRHALLSAELDFVVALTEGIRSGSLGGTAVWRRIHELRAEGVAFEEIMADPVGHLGEEGRALQQLAAK